MSKQDRSVKGGMTPRATSGKLTIRFGLVGVNIGLAPLIGEKAIRCTRICPEHTSRTNNKIVCQHGGEELKQGDCLTGYEYGNNLVTFEDSELDALGRTRDGSITLDRYVPEERISPTLYEKPLLMWADQGGEEGYDLLLHLLRENGGALVGKFVPNRSRTTKMLVIRYDGWTQTLVAHVCNYEANVRWNDVALVRSAVEARGEPSAAMLAQGRALLDGITDDFDPAMVTDEYREALEAAIEAKARGAAVEAPAETEAPNTDDLMAALRATVEARQQEKAAAEKPKRKPAAKKKVAA
jgi:DNA end-binding protein Ku